MENQKEEINKTNLLKPINNNPIFFILGIGILILVIAIFLILFKVSVPSTLNNTGTPKSAESISSNILIILSFVFLLFILCTALLPSLKDFKGFLSQIQNVMFVVIYTIFLTLFFRLMPGDTINTYAGIITPITILFGIFMFYKAFQQNYVEIFNVNYERIKTMILLFCLITLCIIYYVTDPGGYITKYFGYSMVLSILLTVFIFLYLIILITVPDGAKTQGAQYDNLLSNFSKFSVWGSVSFIAFIITIVIGIYTSGVSNFLNNPTESAAVIILLLLACILWGLLLFLNIFPEFPTMANAKNISTIEKMNYFKKALLILFGLIISGLLIGWISYNIQHLSGNSSSSIISFILNILLIVVVLGLVYKTVIVKLPYGNSKKNAFFSLLMNIIFYIPCLFTEGFESITRFFIGQYNATTYSSLLLLLLAIVLLVLYFTGPLVYNKVNLQGGKLLVNKPVYTNTNYSLGTYKDLNGTENFDYQYAISFWFFLDAVAPNTNENSTKYTSLLNFGEKPNVLYNTKTNSLKVTMQSNVNIYNNQNTKLTNTDAYDNTILYENDKVLLQKWNNMIINYNGGVMDIFLNGELVKSVSGVVPYYTLDNLTIGEDNGVSGGICNVVYFNKPLTAINIYYVYNMVKNHTPPVGESSNYTIIKDKLTTA